MKMVGFGYDLHRLERGKTLVLGNIKIDSEFGVVAHSDGDVLIHSLVDALLGAVGMGDIGELFPDTDIKYKDMDSKYFLEYTIDLLKNNSFEITNLDITIILQQPKLSPYKLAIKNKIAEICRIDAASVNIKAKTNEKLGYLGNSEGVAAYSICQIEKSINNII
jgi:2-C-methyl-D-erythritol 2,4-cyclodiphosphate synthase